MKKIVWLTLLTCMSVFSDGINWAKDFRSAMDASSKEGKPIIFIATKDGCKYCKMLKEKTLRDPEVVQAINAHFIALQLNLYKPESLIPYMIAVYTRGFPTIWFLNDRAQALYEPIGGYIDAKDMKNALKIVHESYAAHKTSK